MSCDHLACSALSKVTRMDLRYFELVLLRFSGQTQKCFLCVGKHALYIVRRNLSEMWPSEDGGQIYFAHIERLVEDTQSPTDLLILMTDDRNSEWQSNKLFVVTEHRRRLTDNMTVAWQTDYIWRLGRCASLEISTAPLRKKPEEGQLRVQPFSGYQSIVHQGYSMFIHQSFEPADDITRSGSAATFKSDQGFDLKVQVMEPVPIMEIEESDKSHIRWVAMHYKHMVTEHLKQVIIVRNNFYLKKLQSVVLYWEID